MNRNLLPAILPLALAVLYTAAPAHALTPQEVFERAASQTLILELLDASGRPVEGYTALQRGTGAAVTLCELADGATALRLKRGNAEFKASVIKRDGARNLCLLAVEGLSGGMPVTAPLPAEGTAVYAVSNTLGLGLSVSHGVVAAIRRYPGYTLIQHTAAIAPGSEGGGLFDGEGRLVGVLQYRQRDGQNVNFAYPAAWFDELDRRSESRDAVAERRRVARDLLAAQDWPALRELARRWSDDQPELAEAWWWLGGAEEGANDAAAARDAYNQALAREPSSLPIRLSLLRAQLRTEDAAAALATAREGLAYRREDAELWSAIGLCERAAGKPEQALEAFREALRLDPWHAAAVRGMAVLAAQRRDWAEAARGYKRLTRIAPAEPGGWLQLIEAEYRQTHWARVLLYAERMGRAIPGSADALAWKGAALLGLERHGEAIDTLRQALSGKPLGPAWAWHWLGLAYYGVGLFEEAAEAHRQALAIDPKLGGAEANLGLALKDGGRLEEAMALFLALRERNPGDAFAWRQVGYVASLQARFAQAIPALERSLAIDARQAKVWAALMEAYHAEGRLADARRAHETLRQLDAEWAERAYRKVLAAYEGER